MRRDGGATLVELMVVVVIIAIVTALAVAGVNSMDRSAAIARQALLISREARRDAVAMGTLVYPDSSAYRGRPRAPCMPNTQVVITAATIQQYACELDDTVVPNDLPCAAVADDCDWGSPVRQIDLPADVVIAYARLDANAKVAMAGSEARIFYRPDGGSDACIGCAPANLGNPNESLALYLRSTAVTDESVCTTESDRCFKVLPIMRQTTIWDSLP